MAELASKVKSKADPFGFSLSPTSSLYDHSHGQPCVNYQDLRWKTTVERPVRHDAPCAEHGQTRGATMASHLGGATAHSWAD